MAIIKTEEDLKKRPKIIDMEIAVATFIDNNQNLIIPNLSYGMFMHECDLFVLTKSSYGYEIEIKTSKADLFKDFEKRHKHKEDKIKYFYYALPTHLLEYEDKLPEHAGIFEVYWHVWGSYSYNPTIIHKEWKCGLRKDPISKSNYKFSEEERLNLYRLSAMRVWTMKKKFQRLLNKEASMEDINDKINNDKETVMDISIKEAKDILKNYLEIKDSTLMENELWKVRKAILTLLGYSPRQLISVYGHPISVTDLQTDIKDLSDNFNLK